MAPPLHPGDLRRRFLSPSQLTRGRDMLRSAADDATDIFQPLLTVSRGMRRQAAWLRTRWSAVPAENRGPALFLAAAVLLVLLMMPYGMTLIAFAVLGSAGWAGRRHVPAPSEPQDPQEARLQSLYEALVPYLGDPADPEPLFAHGGDWRRALSGYAFEGGRLVRLTLRYPPYFRDSEPQARARIEQLLQGKAGRGREYRFDWDEEACALTVSVPPPLGTGIAAQRFVTGSGEMVLGFTDDRAVQRTVPVLDAGRLRDAPPVVWRTGPRSAEPHLLAAGRPGAGTTTLLRSLALQALQHGDLLVIDGGGTGEFAFLAGHPGLLAVESGLTGALAVLEWAAHETERRLISANRARQAGHPAPQDVRRPLWMVVDRLSALIQIAQAEGRRDPQELLDIPLRHGRPANVAVALGDHTDALESLSPAVPARARARVVLGPAGPEEVRAVLGAPPSTTPAAYPPPGRGYARLGDGPVLRLQVPAAPDPYDEATSAAHRAAVLALLPGVPAPVSMAKASDAQPDGRTPARADGAPPR